MRCTIIDINKHENFKAHMKVTLCTRKNLSFEERFILFRLLVFPFRAGDSRPRVDNAKELEFVEL